MTDTPEMQLFMELLKDRDEPRGEAMDLLVGLDFSGWVLVRKSALHSLCRAASLDYDDFDPTQAV